jgi:hypothetical protein
MSAESRWSPLALLVFGALLFLARLLCRTFKALPGRLDRGGRPGAGVSRTPR